MSNPTSQEMTRPNVPTEESENVSSSYYDSYKNIDDDIDDLLSCFGPVNSQEFAPNIDFSDLELDKNLSEIFEDLQNVVKTEDGENNISLAAGCSSLPDDPINSLWNIQKNIELEEERVEKLRKPRFQTLPAYKKRAKQETQWIEAVHAAKIAVSPETEVEELLVVGSAPQPSTNTSTDLPFVIDGGGGKIFGINWKSTQLQSRLFSVEVISGVEDEVEEVSSSNKLVSPKLSACIDLTADLPLSKSNNVVNTERHLSSDNHFPANSRIFNRSLEELQCTANAISQTFLEKEKSKSKRAPAKSSSSTSLSSSPINKRRKVETSRSILVKNNNNNNCQKKVDIYNSVWVPARQERLQSPSLVPPASPAAATNVYFNHPALRQPPPPRPATPRPTTPRPTTPRPATHRPPVIPRPPSPSVRVRALMPLGRPQVLPSPRAVKLPITGIQQNKTCLLLNVASTNPVLLNKTQILQKISSKPHPSPAPPPGSSVVKSCYNCQKLNSFLPFLGYEFRKQLGTLKRFSAGDSLVLLCEVSMYSVVCGLNTKPSIILLALWIFCSGVSHLRRRDESEPRLRCSLSKVFQQHKHRGEL